MHKPDVLTDQSLLECKSGARKMACIKSSKSNEWFTPAQYIEAARAVLGHIDLDPASCEQANLTVVAKRIFTVADDGLSKPWAGRVFLNPPYCRLQGKFVAKLVSEYDAGNISSAI